MEKSCQNYKNGFLPECAPLAVPFVPMQTSSKPQYETGEAVIRGTLFPGLDLPFKNIVNTKRIDGTALGEIQSIFFAITELQLYLDIHSDDTEALQTLKELITLGNEAKETYVKAYGPLMIEDIEGADRYTWLDNPWPWNYEQ